MGFFKRRDKPTGKKMEVQVYSGSEWLRVKGESNYQRELEAIAGPKTEEGYDLPIVGVLMREPDNQYDPNAIAVYAASPRTGHALKVGYVNRDDAAAMAPGLDRLNAQGETVGLEGRIRGGWLRDDGDEGHFGIWLLYDPADFGIK